MMHYLVFGILLILGAVSVGLSVYIYHSKNRVIATVIESHSDVKKNGQYIEKIRIVHKLSIENGSGMSIIETAMLPVRELKGAKVKAYFDKSTQDFYVPVYARYQSLISAFIICGIACLAVYGMKKFDLWIRFSEIELVALLLAVIAVVSCSQVASVIHPAVVKTKGNFEAFLKPVDRSEEAEIYCLWYGEHRQYAKRKRGMNLRVKPEKTVTLFFNTKTGVVSRMQETVLSVCVSAGAFVAMIVILIIL